MSLIVNVGQGVAKGNSNMLLGCGNGFNHHTEELAVSSQGEGAELILDLTEAWFIVEFFTIIKMKMIEIAINRRINKVCFIHIMK